MLNYYDLKKNLKKNYSDFKKIRIAILSDSASQMLNSCIKAYGYVVKIDFEIYEAEYNQIDLQIFDPTTELYEFKPDFIIINRSTEKLIKDFYKTDTDQQHLYHEKTINSTINYYNTINSRLKSKVIINTYSEINDSVFGNYANKLDSSFIYQLRKINLHLMDLARISKDMFICDIASLSANIGYDLAFDSKMYINADMVYSLDFLPFLAKNYTDIILSITGVFNKCIILDLDNTLWGGIIGDDGIEGVQIGYFGFGKIFTELQNWVKQLKQRGIIVAICSKNTEEIAKEPFLTHPDMVLRMDDIAVFVANWETKVDNIKYIQSVLNIGFDSMVFLDDNPFEREMVKSAIPDITVPEMPDDAAEYNKYLRSLNLFEVATFTEEDQNRTRQYQEEAKRIQLFQKFENENDFLASLKMEALVKPFDSFSIPRMAQLTQRSNQFNLRTIRYTEENINKISSDTSYYTLSFSLKDIFGDHGLIGMVILKNENVTTLFIDTWIMSCRVLKRGVEEYTLNAIVELAKKNNFESIKGEFIPTKKNGIVKELYLKLGFNLKDDYWYLDVENYKNVDTFIN